jgi:hypothetical protein
MKAFAVALTVAQFCFISPVVADYIVIVPGTANPLLADPANRIGGVPFDGTIPPSFDVMGGWVLTFSATGATHNAPAPVPDGRTPDGQHLATSHFDQAYGGISRWNLPLNSLVGVFLGTTIGAPPPPIGSQLDFTTLSPQLGQVFFIGDGLTGTGTGTRQLFHVPLGATHLWLASLDSVDWGNNSGFFEVRIEQAVPEPSSLALAFCSLAVVMGLSRSRLVPVGAGLYRSMTS